MIGIIQLACDTNPVNTNSINTDKIKLDGALPIQAI